jgi:uncharacterized protein involved in exopolysaccharide biosynthesis
MGSQTERKPSEWHQQESVNLRDVLFILFKHKTIIAIVFMVTVIAVTLVSFLVPPTYEANSNLLVKLGREYINPHESGETRNLISQEELINSEIEILRSRDLIEKVITTLGIENMYPTIAENPPTGMTPLQAAIIKMQKNLIVEGIKKSNVISVTFRNNYPDIAAKTVNLLTELYREKHLKMFGDTNSSFLEDALVSYDHKLIESETNIEAFKQKYKVFSLDEQRNLLLRQRMEIDTSLKNARVQINEYQKRLFSLKEQAKAIVADKSLYTHTDRDRIVVEARARLLGLEIDEKELLVKYKEDNPLVIKIRSEIDLVNSFLKEQEEEIMTKVKSGNVVYQEAEKQIIVTQADLSSQRAKATSLEQQLSIADKGLQDLELREKELNSLMRDRDANEKNYMTYLERLEEAKIADEMNRQKMANVTIINPADIPVKPIKPKKTLNIIIGIIFGMISGIGLAFLREYMSQGLSTPSQAERRLGLKVLVSVPYKKGYQ